MSCLRADQMQNDKIPIVIGVTGHRNLIATDIPAIKGYVEDALTEIRNQCSSSTPIIMLNAFAEGADILCAEVAFAMNIDVYALLPCPLERYVKSFDDREMALKLPEYLAKTKRIIIAPDIENNKEWIDKLKPIKNVDYEYRQMGICMASSSHILLALWDGNPSKQQFGCGTADVVKFALEQNYLSSDHLYRPGLINDCAVEWISVRRQGDGAESHLRRVWLSSKFASINEGEIYCDRYLVTQTMPSFVKEIINKTIAYNCEKVDLTVNRPKLWKTVDELDNYHKVLRNHYIKADKLSYAENQIVYTRLLFVIACLGTLVALFFTLYDDASIKWMIWLCTAAVMLLIAVTKYGQKRKVHEKYVDYRALAEAIRIQFYVTMVLQNKPYPEVVCNLYSWTQKSNYSWISKAIKSIAIINERREMNIERTQVVNVWLGNSSEPSGQLNYHNSRINKNRNRAKLNKKVSSVIRLFTICIYILIFIFEIVSNIFDGNSTQWFWDGFIVGEFSWRNLGVILVGTATAGSLLFSGYFDKLSYDRKADDNEHMISFYSSACERWKEVNSLNDEAALEKFIKEVAREEIVENGIWCSYVMDNGLEIEL